MKSLSPKTTYSFLGLIGVLTLVLGFTSLTRVIQNPAKQTQTARLKALEQASIANFSSSDEALKNQDTDQDGLSDFDELNIYGTSPYLPDSDSDGASDSQELESGSDPNCPTGQNCRTNRIAPPDSQEQILENFGLEGFDNLLEINEIEPEQPFDRAPASAEATADRQGDNQSEIDITQLSPDQIRQLLLESGDITQEQLDQIDDETLLEIYAEVIGQGN